MVNFYIVNISSWFMTSKFKPSVVCDVVHKKEWQSLSEQNENLKRQEVNWGTLRLLSVLMWVKGEEMTAPAAPTSKICNHLLDFPDKGATRWITSGRRLQMLSETQRGETYLSWGQKRTNLLLAKPSPFHELSFIKLFGQKQQIVLW